MRRLAPAITRVAGALLVASGAYLILYWLPTLRGEAVPDSGLSRFSGSFSSELSEFFAAHSGEFAAGLAALVAVGIGVIALERRRRQGTPLA